MLGGMQGSVTQAPLLDAAGWGSWHGCDAAVACEVVEHVHEPDAFARSLLVALRHAPLPLLSNVLVPCRAACCGTAVAVDL